VALGRQESLDISDGAGRIEILAGVFLEVGFICLDACIIRVKC